MRFTRFFLLFVLLISATFSFGQLNFGLKAGVTSFDFNASPIFVESSTLYENLSVQLDKAHYGFTGGMFLYWDLGFVVVNPEISVSSIAVDYKLRDAKDDIKDSIKSESYTHLNLPFLVGFDIGFLQLKGGPVGHYFLKSTSELFEIEEYSQKWNNLDWGYQAGIGIKISALMFDFRYEKNNSNFGSHFVFNDTNYEFDQRNTRYIATLGILF